MLLAKRIKKIRQIKMLSQEEMADKLEISQPSYSLYEKEAANLTFKTIVKIALVLDCSIPFLVDIYSTIYHEDEWRTSIK